MHIMEQFQHSSNLHMYVDGYWIVIIMSNLNSDVHINNNNQRFNVCLIRANTGQTVPQIGVFGAKFYAGCPS